MNRKAIALLSGGLDSQLAIAIVKAQGIEIEALNFQTMFGCCKDDARQSALELGVPYTTLKVGDDYLKVVQKPKYGYGRGINPCVDCRIYMFQMARDFMRRAGASFLISGEVLAQRPMSQKARDLAAIERDADLEGLILRPLSAKRLKPTLPEKAGIVDREKLYGIQGRSRQKLLQLAREFGIHNPPQPSSGCALTQPAFAEKVRDVFGHRPEYQRWEFEILRTGRHFRLDQGTKAVLAKNQEEGRMLEALHPEGTVFLRCVNFPGPAALLIGKGTEETLQKTAALMLRYARKPLPAQCRMEVKADESRQERIFSQTAAPEFVEKLRIT